MSLLVLAAADGVAPGAAVTGILLLALGLTAFGVTFLLAQRATGRPPPEVEDALRQAQVLEGLGTDLKGLRAGVAQAAAPADVVREMDETLGAVDEAAAGLRRGAERVV